MKNVKYYECSRVHYFSPNGVKEHYVLWNSIAVTDFYMAVSMKNILISADLSLVCLSFVHVNTRRHFLFVLNEVPALISMKFAICETSTEVKLGLHVVVMENCFVLLFYVVAY